MNTMKCIQSEWNPRTGGYQRTWLADDESELTADFDPESNPGSAIYVIATKGVYVKNTKGQWQKAGTTEVIE